jgi:dUTP pyrophosphatase
MLFGDFSKSKPTKFSNIHDVFKEEKFKDYRPTLVPTGVKIYLDDDKSFDIQARSSLPRKNWLIVANAPGLIDADYVDNPDNEG